MLQLRDLFKISFKQLYRQKRRNFGVAIAIAFGTAGMIAILTMGEEVKKTLNRDLDLLGGATLIKVSFNDHMYRGEPRQWFYDKTVEALRKVPGVQDVSLTAGKILWFRHSDGKKRVQIPMQGVDASYWRANGIEPLEGRLFTTSEVQDQALVCVLGTRLAKMIYGSHEAAVGKYLAIQKDFYKVVGVATGLQLRDRETYMFTPVTTLVARKYENLSLANRLYIRCRTWDDVKPVTALIPEIVTEHQQGKYLKLEVAWEQLERFVSVLWWVELFVYLATAATLALGGFGIWNGMMSAVTSRTREIGLKKSLGAEDLDILKQFLTEALLLCLLAVVIGVGMGRGIVVGLSEFLDSALPDELFVRYSVISLGFSIVLGLVAGFYPALRASKLDVVAALKFE